jgi:hypothetical protein
MRLWACLALLCACNDHIAGQQPVGGDTDSDAQIQRFLRRATLDLSGHPPDDATLAADTATLHSAGDTAVARGAIVDRMMSADDFGKTVVGELQNTIFGGQSVESQYQLVCGLIVGGTPDCMSCAGMGDPCACTCPELAGYAAERASLEASATDLVAGTSTSAIEKRHASAKGYSALAGLPETLVKNLFTDFLARTAEQDEVDNGRAMIIGPILGAGSKTGLLFQQLGSDYNDLISIIFGSEVYREAVVVRVFERYLARDPSPAELTHFVSTLDANVPDARPVIRAVVSSREYFAQ